MKRRIVQPAFPARMYLFLLTAAFLTACSGSQKIQQAPVKDNNTKLLADTLVKKQSSGTDFYASGNYPVTWMLDMDIDKEFVFTAGDIKASVAAVKPSSAANNEMKTYHSSTTNGEMDISIYKDPCATPGQSQKVEVKFNNTLYTGCGLYLYNPQLNGNWILEKVGKRELAAAEFSKGLPVFNFSTDKRLFGGTDGCGSVSGPILIVGSRINFGGITTTGQSCKNESVRNIVKTSLSNFTADYFFKDGKLILYLVDDSQLTLRKAN